MSKTPIIVTRLPEFMKTLYPEFTQFITTYFTQLEQQGEVINEIAHFLENVDSGNVNAQYWDKILADLSFNLNETFSVDRRLLVLFIRHYYMSRGTAKSIEFLFKLLYSDNPKVSYPREKLLIPSATEYRNQTHMYLLKDVQMSTIQQMEQLATDFGLVGRGITSGASMIIDKVDIVEDRIRLHISTTNTFLPHESIEITGENFSHLFTNVPTLDVTPVTSSEPITEFEFNAGNVPVKVTLLDSGLITGISVETAGTGYAVGDSIVSDDNMGFYATVKTVSGTGEIQETEIHNNGIKIVSVPNLIVYSREGKNAVLRAVPDDKLGRPLRMQVGSPVFEEFTHAPYSLKFKKNAIYTTPKDWVNDNHRIGHNGVLIDSFYWHQFSYLIESGVSRPEYEHFVKEQVHPPGYELFSALGLKAKDKLIQSFDGKLQNANKNFLGVLYSSVIANLSHRKYTAWQQGSPYKIGDVVIRGNNVYIAISNGEAGHLPPRHTKGAVSDGGLLWQYVQTVNADLAAISQLYLALSLGGEPVKDAFYAKKINYTNIRLGIKYKPHILGDRVEADTLYKTQDNELFYCIQGGISTFTPAPATTNSMTADGVVWRYAGTVSNTDLDFVTDDFVPMVIKDTAIKRDETVRTVLLQQYGQFRKSDVIVSNDETETTIDYEIAPDGKLINHYVSSPGKSKTDRTVILSNKAPGSGARARAEIVNGQISKIVVEENGTGYRNAMVVIVGDGQNASAIVNIDSLGAVTGIDISNSGSGYTKADVYIVPGTAAAVFRLERKSISPASVLYALEPDAMLIHVDIHDVPGYIDHTARYDQISILTNANANSQMHLSDTAVHRIDKDKAIAVWHHKLTPKVRSQGQHEKVLIAITLE